MQEIADEIGISKEDIVFALDAIQAPMSLQEPVYNDGGDALYVMDQVSDTKNREEKWVEKLSLEAAMDHLDERERHIIRLRFFEGKMCIRDRRRRPGRSQDLGARRRRRPKRC